MDQNLVGWICSILVILFLLGLLFNELVKRWKIGVRLSIMDESLLEDDNISIEDIIQAPQGSVISQKTPIIPMKEDDWK
ncbi:MAG: hypothetical protein CL993_00240 [Euryarchaeota archaeon]|nr:hypothetical protein [Euryarchaeota archaeon]|tara:strand:- start:506 stop:742 length:237 start_codon:yes stop_codon:yes gene_type:complete